MIGLYRPKILLIKSPGGEYLEKLLSMGDVFLFIAKDIEEAKTQLEQANIDAIVTILDRKNNKLPDFFSKTSSNIPKVIIEGQAGSLVPKDWRENSDIFLRKKTAQESLIKIFFDLLEQKKALKKAA